MTRGNEVFSRVERLLGTDALRRLAQAQVTVAGLGAVGSFAVEALARSGVGRLRIVDFDRVEPTNINRQLYALHSTIGRSKAEIAAERIHDIAPDCLVEAIGASVNNENVLSILSPEPDVVVDAIDSVRDKVSLLCACLSRKIPVISSMGAALRSEPTFVRVGALGEVQGCPLARSVRNGLKKAGMEFSARQTGLRCVFSTEAVMKSSMQDRCTDGTPRALGSLVCVTGVFGLVAAREAIRLIVDGHARAPGSDSI